ncbi:MAG: diguanylate cyclase [Pseudomonadota bacterium]
MEEAPTLDKENEARRLAALQATGLLYTPAEERFDRITQLATQIFDVPVALVSLVAANVQWFKSAQGLAVSETPREISFCGHAIASNTALVVQDATADARFADNPLVLGDPGIRFYAGQPLSLDGENIGTLCVIDRRPRVFSEAEANTLASMARWVENEVKITSLYESQKELSAELDEVRRASLIDPLTMVWNRRGLAHMLATEVNRAQRKGTPVSVMLVDLDFFKEVNDTYGHPAGDLALKEAARILSAALRPQDVVCRYGGDEFLVLLGDCPEETAVAVSERILMRVRDKVLKLDDQRKFGINFSIGIATSDYVDDSTFDQLVEYADRAVYQSKDAGRDRASLFAHALSG